MIFNYIPALSLPVILLTLPLTCALLFFSFEVVTLIYARLNKQMSFELGRMSMRVIFFAANLLEMIISLYLWYRFQGVQPISSVPVAAGWTTTLMSVSGLAVHSYIQVDVFSATMSVLTSFVALIACFSTLANKIKPLTGRKAIFYLLTLSGVQGIFFSSGLFNLFTCMVVSQIGASGLVRPVLRERQEFVRTVCYFISRFLTLGMFLAGSIVIAIKYSVFRFSAAWYILQSGYAEKSAFALLVAPLLYLFIKPPIYTVDAASRCYFAIRANAAFFVFFKIIFALQGAIDGFERIPALIGAIGIIAVFASMVFSAKERDPIRFATAIESSLKGCILIALAMSVSGVYSAAAIVDYGYGALEALMQLLLIFLPVSAALSVTSAHLKQVVDMRKLWLSSGHFSQLAYTGLLFAMAVCMLVGLPPLAGFAARQFLYRSANTVNPFLMLYLFTSSVFILFTGLRFIAIIIFGKSNYEDYVFEGDSAICLPLSLLFLLIVSASSVPGALYGKITAPTVSLVVSSVQLELSSELDKTANQQDGPTNAGELETSDPINNEELREGPSSTSAVVRSESTPSVDIGERQPTATRRSADVVQITSVDVPDRRIAITVPNAVAERVNSAAKPLGSMPRYISQLASVPKRLYDGIIAPAVDFVAGKIWPSGENGDDDEDVLELPSDEFDSDNL